MNPIAQDELSSCCVFGLSPKIQPKNILRAQLWVHLRPADVVTTVFLQISRLKPGKEGNNTRVRVRSLKIDTDAAGAGSWQSVDIKSLLQAWLRQPEANYGIEINAYDSKGEDLAVTSSEPGEEGLVSGIRRGNRPGLMWCPGLLGSLLFHWVFSATVYRSEDPRHPQEISPRLGPQLRRGICGDALLPVPPHSRLRGVRVGLDHRSQALPGQLLLGRVRVLAPAAVPARTPGEQGQPSGHGRALLHAHQDVTHQYALLQPQGADQLRKDPVHGGGPLRLLLRNPCRSQAPPW